MYIKYIINGVTVRGGGGQDLNSGPFEICAGNKGITLLLPSGNDNSTNI